MNIETRHIALRYSNKELLRHWEMFADYPTTDRGQRARMDALLRGKWPDEEPIGKSRLEIKREEHHRHRRSA